MDIRIRPLGAADEPFLWTMLYHALHVPAGAEAFAPDVVRQPEIARYVDGWMQRPGDLGFAAEADGAPCGAAWLRRWLRDDQGFGYVDCATPELSMAVLPEYRGGGIGTALLGRLMTAAARDADAVSLSVARSNPARRLYERFGFAAVGEPGGDAVTLRARL